MVYSHIIINILYFLIKYKYNIILAQYITSSETKYILFSFLSLNCHIDNSNYVIDYSTFKKALNNNNLKLFIEEIEPFYKYSKKSYLDISSYNYNKFLTVIRQICNFNNIILVKKVKYIRSKYMPIFYINKMLEEV